MAVDYTKLFTLIGAYVDKVIDYNAQISTYTADQAAIEALLATEGEVHLADDLVELFDSFKEQVPGNIDDLINRVTSILTDDELIGANFSFGQSPTLNVVFPALLKDMAANDKNVKANVSTVGTIVYTTANTLTGKLLVGTKLDALTPPTAESQAQSSYNNLTTQLTPTAETLTFTCITDSEGSATRGSEVFELTGTGPASRGYSVDGYSIGSPGTLTCIDNSGSTYLSNASFDTWAGGEPTGWTNTGDNGTYLEDAAVVYGTGASLKTVQADDSLRLEQVISSTLLPRGKSFFISLWAAKDTDVGGDETLTIVLEDDNGAFNFLNFSPTTTAWTHYYFQVIPPAEIAGDVVLTLSSGLGVLDAANDPVLVDNIVIVPCEYHAGVALAIVSGPEKFLIGDTIAVPLSNDDAGKFQTFFRKAYGVQLPTDATPTLSDTLVT